MTPEQAIHDLGDVLLEMLPHLHADLGTVLVQTLLAEVRTIQRLVQPELTNEEFVEAVKKELQRLEEEDKRALNQGRVSLGPVTL